jgi:hypothetical protein
MEVDCRSDLIGGRINAIEFVVSCPLQTEPKGNSTISELVRLMAARRR